VLKLHETRNPIEANETSLKNYTRWARLQINKAGLGDVIILWVSISNKVIPWMLYLVNLYMTSAG